MREPAPSKRLPALIGTVALAVLVVLVVLHAGRQGGSGGSGERSAGQPGAGQAARSTVGASGLSTIRLGSLPAQARRTVELIAAGGPFPYPRDGAAFSNREGILPGRAYGYYREYTVVTPGSSDRGARRIIAGQGGEEFYTDDHYASFQEIVP